MKLLFLCTSLEPGRDGVGDYSRLLAEACIEAGHTCRLLALNDTFIESAREEIQRGRQHEITCLRFPASGSWGEKLSVTQAYTNAFAPEWLSWQLVPYGFHPKGIIPDEVQAFHVLGQGRYVHIMLHELWIGLSVGEPMKNRVWGMFQRRALNKFITHLHAIVLHTTNTTYGEVLRREKWQSSILPLFGNIPVTKMPPIPPDAHRWTGVIFGTVHPQFSPKHCFDTLVAGASASRRKLRILGIGRVGEYGEKMFAKLEKDYAGRLEALLVGEKTPEEVSCLLQAADLGIATHPWALAGKSGAIAAMLDHGLPVVVSRDDWALRRQPISVPSIDPIMIRLSKMPPELMAGRLAARGQPEPRLPKIASTFLSSLGVASASPVFET
jgi:hypothetical protein